MWKTAWLAVLGASHGVIGNVSGLVNLEVVGLKRQAVMVSLSTVFTGVAMLLVGPLAGVHLSLVEA